MYWHTNNLWYREEVGRYAPFPSVNFGKAVGLPEK